jgi:hypothetical protein
MRRQARAPAVGDAGCRRASESKDLCGFQLTIARVGFSVPRSRAMTILGVVFFAAGFLPVLKTSIRALAGR